MNEVLPQEKPSLFNKKLVLFLVFIDIFLIIVLVLLQSRIRQLSLQKKNFRLEVKKEKKVSILKPGEIRVTPSSNVSFEIQIDTSTPSKKAFYDLFKKTLKEAGYSLTLYHSLDSFDKRLKLPGDPEKGRRWSGCFAYGWDIDSSQRTIDVFFYRDPTKAARGLSCGADQVTGVIGSAISAAKGDRRWLAEGTEEIQRRYEIETLTADHMPIEVKIRNVKGVSTKSKTGCTQ